MASGEYQGCPPRVVRGSAAQAAIASSVNHTVGLPRDVMAAVLVQLERHSGHPEFGRVIRNDTLRLNTTARSIHHALGCRNGPQRRVDQVPP